MPRIGSIATALLSVLVLFVALPAAAQAATAPVAAYGFEDAGTSVGDSSTFGNDGAIQGGATRTAGRFGSAINFDGVNDRVNIPDASSLNLASGMTLEAWVKPTTVADFRTVILKERLTDLNYGLYAGGADFPTAYMATDSGTHFISSSQLDVNVWAHLAATYDGATFRLFIDGAQVASQSAIGQPMIPGNGPLSIGGNTVWGEWFKGLIDEVRIYDRPLSAAEIQTDMGTAVGNPQAAIPPPASQVGSWTAPMDWPMVAVHSSMLSNGKVVAWDAFDAAPQSEHVWDPETNQFASTPSGINLFCAGHVLLPDGRLFVAGGHLLGYVGLPDTRLFNPLTQVWTAGPDMARGRWYPTTTTLPDGRVLIVSGDGIRSGPNDPYFVRPSDTIPEVYDPKTNTLTAMPQSGRLMPLYPYMFVAPDGRVVDAGPDQTTRFLDMNTGQWTAITSKSPITGGSAVMYRPGKVLTTGTWTNTDFGDPPIVNKSAVLDLDQAVPAWRSVAPMKWARTYHTLTVLPDGQVLSMGGQAKFGADRLRDSPVLQPEIWNPATDTWTALASSVRPRGYHNTSLLLPDGRILLAGSGRLDGSLMVNETTAEVYSPPYLHKGPRPTITSAPGTMQYGGKIDIETPDAAGIAKVSLVRIGSVTHNFNMDQRWQELDFRQVGSKLEVDAPTSANIAPPGVYYVFILNANGVPSKAAILSIPAGGGQAPDTSAPTAPSNLQAIGALGKVTLSWGASTDDTAVTRYVVHRSTTAGFTPSAATQIATVDTGTGYTDNVAAGTYYYRVIAQDAAGNSSAPSAQASGTALADTTPPAVAVTAPAAGATVGGTVTITANATDNVAVASVQFRVDGADFGAADTSAPYSIPWNTAGLSGNHTLAAVARDATGNSATSATVSVTVNNSVPAGPSPVAAYAFEEGTGGTVADATGKGHTGTIREAAWTTAGKNGKALQFDGVNDWVAIDDAADLRLSTGMTLEAWVNPSSLTGWRTVIMKERAGDLAYALYGAQNKPSLQPTNGTVTGPSNMTLNAWTHVAGTYDGAVARVYVNGSQVATLNVANALVASNGTLRIGGNSIWAEWFAGKIDDVRIYDKALTAAQIQADMNTPVGPPAPTDTTPPSTPQGLTAANAMGKVTLNWTAATDNVGVTRYVVHRSTTAGFTPSAGTAIATVPSGTSYVDNAAAGTYYYRVIAEDAAGNASPPSAEIQGKSLTDTTPPSAPTGLATTNALGKVTLNWSASTDDVGVVRYAVHRATSPGFTPIAATKIATVASGTSYVDNVAAGTYYYRVIAEDAAGNASAPSGDQSGTSLADTTAPTVSVTAPAAGSTVKATVSITAGASDNVGVAGVQFVLDGSYLGAEDTAAPYSASWDTTTAVAGSHTLSAIARDAAGNVTQSASVTVTVDNSVPAGPAPVAAYSFEEGSGGTVADVTGKGHAGTIREAAWVTAGKNGKALQFDGVNDWVAIDDAADLRFASQMTLEAWVNPSTLTGWRTVIMKERSGDLAYALYGAQSKASLQPTTGTLNSPANLTLNAWTHVAGTYDGSVIRLYVNGTQVATQNRTGALTASTGALRLGGNSVWGEWFKGLIDDVRVYDKALTAAQIQADMNTALPATAPASGPACASAQPNTADGPDPWGGCFPGPQNTGVPAGTTLTNYTGPCTITAANTVIDSKTVNCDLEIEAAGVTIRNSRINGMVWIDDPAPNYSFTISDSTIDAGPVNATENDGKRALGKSHFTATRVETIRGIGGAWCEYDCTVRDSWIHGQDEDEAGVAHQSGIRMGSGTPGAGQLIQHNTIVCDAPSFPPDGGCSADLTGYGDFAPIQNNTISNNLLGSTTGGTCAYGGSTAGKLFPDGSNNVFRDNIFQRGPGGRSAGPVGKCGDFFAVVDLDGGRRGNDWINNRWDTGEIMPSNG